MTDKPRPKVKDLHLPPIVDLEQIPSTNVAAEIIQAWKSRSVQGFYGLTGVLDYHTQVAMVDPLRYSPAEILKWMREQAELASDLATGRIPFTEQSGEEQDSGDNFIPTNEECYSVMESIFEEVVGGTLDSVNTPVFKNRAPTNRKQGDRKPVQKNLEGGQGYPIPLETTEEHKLPSELVGEQNGGAAKPSRQIRRVVKIRKVVKPTT